MPYIKRENLEVSKELAEDTTSHVESAIMNQLWASLEQINWEQGKSLEEVKQAKKWVFDKDWENHLKNDIADGEAKHLSSKLKREELLEWED